MLEQGIRQSFPFPISSSFGTRRRINICCLLLSPPPAPGEGVCGLRLMRPLIGSIRRLPLLCAAMHRCLFCRSWRVMDGLSRGERDPAAAAREIGVSPRAAAALGWAVRGGGGLCAGPRIPTTYGLHFFAEVWGGSPNFCF